MTLVFTKVPSAALVSYLITLAFTERARALTVRPQSPASLEVSHVSY